MNPRHTYRDCLVASLVTLGASLGWSQALWAQQDQTVAAEGVEVLTRGPVHEAFAETIAFDPQPGIVVPKAPPEPIEELPPAERPEGDNVAWISGYWGWDDDREDFLWVSGIWRSLPPGRQWITGYWGQAGQNYQWTSGYWADAGQAEVQYLPEAPATVEVGPNIAAPSANHLWAPGSWVWNQSRYAWRPGYWSIAQQNWVWVPAHYVWTPRGYVFVDGYYDYSVARRGVLFAPVYFNASVYAQRGFTYRPAMVINPAVFASQLFLRPNYGHYYFGDYYGGGYASAGFQPWFSYNSGGYGYDPFYAQARWQNRQNAAWAQTVQSDFQYRVDHEDARPPRTLAAQQALATSGGNSTEKNLLAVAPLAQLAKSKDSPLRFQSVSKEEQQQLATHGQQVQQHRAERQKLEATGAVTSPEKPGKEFQPARVKLPKSPLLSKPLAQLGAEHAPPKSHEAPAPDLKVEPKPRKVGVAIDPPSGERTVPKPAPKVEPKPALKVEPKTTPRVEPKPAPRVEPKPAPKVEPKPAPRVEPKPAPKAEPKPAPKVGPKPAPKVEPKPKPPKGEPKDKHGADGTDKVKK